MFGLLSHIGEILLPLIWEILPPCEDTLAADVEILLY